MTLAVAIVLIAYNNVLNRWRPFNGPLYVPFNLTLTLILGLLAVEPLDLSAGELGLDGSWLPGLAGGLAAAALITAPLFLTARSRWRDRIADKRVTHLRGWALAYQTLLRIPIGTALLEEFAFRGVLYGALLERGTLEAALLSSVTFGLWHVGPSINMARANDRDVPVTVVGTVLFTTLVGLAFVWLREWSGSLAFPLALHAGVNSLATLAAVRARAG